MAGVHYLHSYRPVLVHGDLKPVRKYPRYEGRPGDTILQRNILIDDTGNAQICDFGLVRVCVEDGKSGTTTTTAHTGTERYLARELLVEGDEARPTRASDIYALGCIGLEVRLQYHCEGMNLHPSHQLLVVSVPENALLSS